MIQDLALKNAMLLVFAYLYDLEDYNDVYFPEIIIKYSAKEIAKDIGISERNARRVLNLLRQESFIKMAAVKNNNLVYVYWIDKKEIIKKINNHEKMGS